MENFIKSLFPVFGGSTKVRDYFLEILLVIAASVITVISYSVYRADKSQTDKKNFDNRSSKDTLKTDRIRVNLSGAVKFPGVYEASNGEILDKIINRAGGLTEEADKEFFQKYFNLAAAVVDRDKIYIPTQSDVKQGYSGQNENLTGSVNSDSLININSAPLSLLDTLPGIGQVTAGKIIDNRPYGALEELINKKVLNKNSLEKIKNLIRI